MLLRVLDGEGQLQTVITPGVESPEDFSGAIAVANTAQEAIPADNEGTRSGVFIMNTSLNMMYVQDGDDPAAADGHSFPLPSGGMWPPQGYVFSSGAISIIGAVAGDKYLARAW